MPTTDTRHSAKSVDNGGLHGTVSILYADAAALASDTRSAGSYAGVLVAGDLGRFARQVDDGSLYILTGVGPNVWSAATGGGGGEVNTASNLAAEGLFSAKSGVDLEFKGIAATSPLSISSSATQVTVALIEINDTVHGSRGGAALHSLATVTVNGFMSSTDKVKLDAFSVAGEYTRRDGTVAFTGSQSHGDNDITGIKTATFDGEIDNGNSGAAQLLDWTAGQKQKVTLDANTTFTVTDPAGPCNLMLKITQDGTGGRSATWPASVKWSKGTAPNLTNGAGSIDLVSLYFDGVDYFGAFADDFS